MLVELAIRNFAIIDTAEIQFGPGLNALTGETGAGKSILIDALGAVLGDRTRADMVRSGAKSSTIDAIFHITNTSNDDALARLLSDLQIQPEEDNLILSREIQSGGRSSSRLNGRPTTASVLAQVGALLVDVHGQSDHLSLLRPAVQLELLDRFAQSGHLRETFSRTLGELRGVQSALTSVRSGARERIQRIDLLRFQIDEIRQAQLREGEEEELISERARLSNADRLARDAATVYEALAGGDDVIAAPAATTSLRQAVRVLEEMATLDPQTSPFQERLNEMLFSIEDLSAEIRGYRDELETDPARLEIVEERLDGLRQLQRKYGADTGEILRHAESAETELESLTGSDTDADSLARREEALAHDAGALAKELSRIRAAAAAILASGVEQSISELRMGSAEFAVSLNRVEDESGIPVLNDDGAAARYATDATGIDRVTFMIASNSGESLKPLGRVASGGETARLMLALKSILSDADQTPTLVFDEIDVGVGGRSGQVVGEKLAKLVGSHQVIVITHLPQIAAFADTHFRIVKEERKGRAVSMIEQLDESSRHEELAAMLDGTPVTASSLQSASEMLRRAASRLESLRRLPR